jgi:uncharacterized membrane protein YphA (DoxX/SURF4 family)
MRLSAKVRRAPGRLAAGSYILNSGLSKLSIDDQATVGLHAMATASYPALKRINPKLFTMVLASAEISLGTALLLPVVPTAAAGLGLAAFSGGLLSLYLRSPGTRLRESLRPTEEGLGLAKDIWMLGIATGLLADAVTDRRSKGSRNRNKD